MYYSRLFTIYCKCRLSPLRLLMAGHTELTDATSEARFSLNGCSSNIRLPLYPPMNEYFVHGTRIVLETN